MASATGLRVVCVALASALAGTAGAGPPGQISNDGPELGVERLALSSRPSLAPELETYRASFVERLQKLGPADAFWPSQTRSVRLFRCHARDAQKVEAGEDVRDGVTRMLLTLFQPMTIDAETGVVRFSGLESPTRWNVVQKYGQARDLILQGGHPSDGIWIRAWKVPLGFIAIENSQIVVTGTCQLGP